MNSVTKKIRIYGVVQGVGFRPTVARHAKCAGIHGTVSNTGSCVEIIAQGPFADVENFIRLVREEPPERASILKMDIKDIPEEKSKEYRDFQIIESVRRKGEIFVSPDIAICPECQKELFDPANRRYLHPFINCTQCGPRLTILESLPYDRERTSMKVFPMCGKCAGEYHDPASRRYDAQPVCCNDCGPEVYLAGEPDVRGREAILRTRKVIREGGIAAVKGIGGFHLCCDAVNEKAVEELRRRKKRPAKPFAVMCRDLAAAQRECFISKEQEKILTGVQKPILLLDKRKGKICEAAAPDNPKLGVMLPYAPVQLLLLRYDDGLSVPDCFVMTSGNVSGAPICRDDEEALRELGGTADIILSNNRKILIRCDDSVMDFYDGKPYMIRRSRGYAPLPFMITESDSKNSPESRRCSAAAGADLPQSVLAVGGELKNTFVISRDNLFYPSSYIGDLEDERSGRALGETIGRMETLLEVSPTAVAADLHPGYRSTAIAREIARERKIPLIQIQHHYAHVLSCMAENDYSDPVIGVSYDGTGYGEDGTVWGGEILLARTDGFRRLSSIMPFQHVGGDTASRQGWRIAVSLIHDLYESEEKRESLIKRLELSSAEDCRLLFAMQEHGVNTVQSTSCGRLFDAVSAVLGIRKQSTFEGEASTALMYEAEREMKDSSGRADTGRAADDDLEDRIPEELLTPVYDEKKNRLLLRTDLLMKEIIRRAAEGKEDSRGPGRSGAALFFHRALAAMTVRAIVRLRKEMPNLPETAALSGGCFQNLLLLDLTKKGLEREGFRVLIHSLIPPNDGGIALGQAFAAEYSYKNHE